MSSKDFMRRHLFLFAASVVSTFFMLCAPVLSQTGEKPAEGAGGPQAEQAAPAAQAEPARASSPLWQSVIWENFPDDRLKGSKPDAVSRAYQANGWKPFFINAHFQLNENAKLVLERLGSLQNEAIDPGPYRIDEIVREAATLAQARELLKASGLEVTDTACGELSEPPREAVPVKSAGEGGGPASAHAQGPAENRPDSGESLQKYQDAFKPAARLDISLAAAFTRFADEMDPFSADDQVKALTGETPMRDVLKELEPASGQYRALVASYARYRALAAAVRQQPVNFSATIHPGDTGNQIRDLQKRLEQEGFYAGTPTGVYDARTQRAVKSFQAAHLLDADGAVGRRTAAWLNVSFADKVDMIAYAMKTLRQSRTRVYDRFIRINIPQFILEYYRDGKVQETHRIIVGKAAGKKVKYRGRMVGENNTPTLYSTIEQVILNPRWYVSDRIRLELDSEAKADPEWFTRHGYVQMTSTYPWGEPRIFQRPGPENALGRVKFEFPNVYAIYLHDTPKKQLFRRTRRDFSHGCIRVDRAVELAKTLLTDDKSPYADRLPSILDRSTQAFVRLTNPVPIAIEYVPVCANDQGQVIFLGDPYGIVIVKENESKKG